MLSLPVQEPPPIPAPFKARLFESPAIKSWNESQAPALRAAFAASIETLRAGGSLALDLLVELEAVVLEPRVEAAHVLHWRSRPSNSIGARVRRTLGFYSGESRLAAAVELKDGAALAHFLPGTALWDAEFTLYPVPKTAIGELPDPHFQVAGFAAQVRWSVNQDAGNDSWLLTAQDEQTLTQLSSTLTQAFASAGLASSLADAPSAVFAKHS